VENPPTSKPLIVFLVTSLVIASVQRPPVPEGRGLPPNSMIESEKNSRLFLVFPLESKKRVYACILT